MDCLNCAKEFVGEYKKQKFCSINCANIYYREKDKPLVLVNKAKFQEMLVKHDKDIEFIRETFKVRSFGDNGKNDAFYETLKAETKIICLVNASCRCERCGSGDKLTVHHVFTRRMKEFMTFNRYLTQRYYWKNIAVLCVDCHSAYHSKEIEWDEVLEPISPFTIDGIKRTFFT